MPESRLQRQGLSRDDFKDLLTFSADVQGYPGSVDPIIRDDNDVLIYANRRRNADGVWEIGGYQILGDTIKFGTQDPDRASIAAILIEEFDPDSLSIDDRYTNITPVKHGVPVSVAVDGKPAIAVWLYVRGEDRTTIAEMMGLTEASLSEYLSRFRRRGTGIADDQDVPAVGEAMPDIPPKYDPDF